MKILVVDSSKATRMIVEDYVSAASGYEIFHSESGKESLAFVKEHKAPGISEVSMLPTDLTYRYSGEELKLYLQRISSIGIIQIVGIYSFTGQPS